MTDDVQNVKPVDRSLVIVCGWCRRVIFTPDDFTPQTKESTGICAECDKKQRAEAGLPARPA